jgi:hypothetical protein
MPFHPLFKTTFTAGDLIYGLATERPKLVVHLGAGILTAGGPATVDQYRASTIKVLRVQDQRDWKSFLRANETHSRYGRYMIAIRAYSDDEEKFAEQADARKQNAAWRAKSKFGMEWTISNARGHIHFVLDGIDMGAVVTKTHRFVDGNGVVLAQDMPRGKASIPDDKERTITHSELRWIYRNRANPLVQQRVQFWRTAANIQTCIPPWEDQTVMTTLPSGAAMSWAQAWRIYKPVEERAIF